jgi:hypothetical protein
MATVLDLVSMPDGRLGVVLDVPPSSGDPSSVALWTEDERRAAFKDVALAAAEEMRERCAAFVMDRSKKAASLRQLAKRRADADAEQVFVQLWKELEMMAHNISSLPLSGDKP